MVFDMIILKQLNCITHFVEMCGGNDSTVKKPTRVTQIGDVSYKY